MMPHESVSELKSIINELSIQNKNKQTREALKIVGIGYLLHRDVDRKIRALSLRRAALIENIIHQSADIELASNQIITELKNNDTYLTNSKKKEYLEKIKPMQNNLALMESTNVFDAGFILAKQQAINNCSRLISNYNDEFISNRMLQYDSLFNNGMNLDSEQKAAIITDDKYNLVVAGAGSGKTQTLITRIAYLIKRTDHIDPNRILALAYQKKAAQEMVTRLEDFQINNVDVMTFHKLGKSILEFGETSPKEVIDDNHFRRMIWEIYKEKMEESSFFKKFIRYIWLVMGAGINERKTGSEIASDEEIFLEIAESKYIALDSTKVKSRAEKEILDFLLTNKLNGKRLKVEYEPNIQIQEGTKTIIIRPDFWIKDYDIFIEHWALSEKGEVPAWFEVSSKEYTTIMAKKKDWFNRNKRPLVEFFSYEFNPKNIDTFHDLLKQRIIEKINSIKEGKYEFTPLTYEEAVALAWAPYKDPTPMNIAIFIQIAKTYDLKPNDLETRLAGEKWYPKQYHFGILATEIYRVYEERKGAQIDFNDMINVAIKKLQADKELYYNSFDHILIDEFQDISTQRYKLIKELLNKNPNCKLFCVGDDWQSIMAFTGANLDFFLNFETYFTEPTISKMCTNYRSVKTIVDAGNYVIKKNKQREKTTVAKRAEEREIKLITYDDASDIRYLKNIARDCVNRIEEYNKQGYLPSDIMILNRYKKYPIVEYYVKDKKEIRKTLVDIIRTEAKKKGIEIEYERARVPEGHIGNKVRLMTVHKSKGLQARVVFLLNVTRGCYGFPCTIQDAKIFEPAKNEKNPSIPLEEERRLFYVGITRAKEDLIIYTRRQNISQFIDELGPFVSQKVQTSTIIPKNEKEKQPSLQAHSNTTIHAPSVHINNEPNPIPQRIDPVPMMNHLTSAKSSIEEPVDKPVKSERRWAGNESFENFIKENLFGSEFELLNWTDDGRGTNIKSEEINKYSFGLLYRHRGTGKKFLFKAIFKNFLDFNEEDLTHLISYNQKWNYEGLSKQNNAECFIIIGEGDRPLDPKAISIIPLRYVSQDGVPRDIYTKYQRYPIRRPVLLNELNPENDYVDVNEMTR